MSDNFVDYYEVFKGSDGQFYVRLMSSNGQTIFVSEGYTDEAYAKSVGEDNNLPSKEEYENGH